MEFVFRLYKRDRRWPPTCQMFNTNTSASAGFFLVVTFSPFHLHPLSKHDFLLTAFRPFSPV